jgi:hypothetical protein
VPLSIPSENADEQYIYIAEKTGKAIRPLLEK